MAKVNPKYTAKDLREYFENPLESTCDVCGVEYQDFDTGETYQSVFDTLWKASDDPAEWLNKGRHTVLGRWHEIKQEMWRDHLDQCAEMSRGGNVEYDNSAIDEY